MVLQLGLVDWTAFLLMIEIHRRVLRAILLVFYVNPFILQSGVHVDPEKNKTILQLSQGGNSYLQLALICICV